MADAQRSVRSRIHQARGCGPNSPTPNMKQAAQATTRLIASNAKSSWRPTRGASSFGVITLSLLLLSIGSPAPVLSGDSIETIVHKSQQEVEMMQQPRDHYDLIMNDNGTPATTTKIDNDPPIKTQVPIIGILTEVLRDYKRFVPDRRLHIASSYVKWIEAAGAQVMPILLQQDDAYYERVFNQTNGLLFPGGDNLLDPSKRTPMLVAARKLYDLAVAANDRGDFYPIWGTCLGMELLSVLTANQNVLEACKAHDIPLSMKFIARGKLFSPATYSNLDNLSADFASVIVNQLETKNLTYNYHQMCLTDASLARAGLADFYRPLAYSQDKEGAKFIAIFEAVAYPFFGVQFHPEKPAFEFVVKKSQLRVPHSRESIAVSRYFADFFVTQAQRNAHQATQPQLDQRQLIYAFDPMYTALKNDMYEQRYLFPYKEEETNASCSNRTSTRCPPLSSEEFLDYEPASDEEPSEAISPAGRRIVGGAPRLAGIK